MQGFARNACLTAVVIVWPLTAWGASASGQNATVLLVAVAIGALIAIASILAAQRMRDRHAQQPLQQALAASTAFWWRADREGRIVEVHDGQVPAGFVPESLRGRLLWQLSDSVPAIADLKAAIGEGRSFSGVSISPASSGPVLLLFGVPVAAPDGGAPTYIGTAQLAPLGVPARRSDVNGLQANHEPDRQLGERTRELDNAVRELDSFAYSVSHDLRAPLRIVDGFATIVLEDYGDRGKALDDVGRDHLRRIVAASQRMNTMIDTLLGLSRMTSRELARERVDLSQIARELTDDLRVEDTSRSIEFVIQPNLRVDGDATLLRLVLQNLLGNAFKFSAKNRAARVEFGSQPDGDATAFYVKDNGAGFDMRFAEKMFGLFQRLHSANEFPGTGVGLATVQKIIRRHGGRVWAEAVPAPGEGHGATFYFTLWEKP